MTQIFDRITVNPKQCGGRPCVRGMRIRLDEAGVLLVVCHTYHEEAEDRARVRLISARKATKNEKKQYQRK